MCKKILAKEGVSSFFKGAEANILRGVAGAGVLALYDRLQMIIFGKKSEVEKDEYVKYIIYQFIRKIEVTVL